MTFSVLGYHLALGIVAECLHVRHYFIPVLYIRPVVDSFSGMVPITYTPNPSDSLATILNVSACLGSTTPTSSRTAEIFCVLRQVLLRVQAVESLSQHTDLTAESHGVVDGLLDRLQRV